MMEDEEIESRRKFMLAFKLHKPRIARTLKLPKERLPGVLAEIEAAILQYRCDLAARSEAVPGEAVTYLNEHDILLPRETYTSKGAPPEVELRAYIRATLMIYEGATGKRITRSVSRKVIRRKVILAAERKTYKKKSYISIENPHPFHAYVRACLRAANVLYRRKGKYIEPTDIIIQVLQELHAEKPASARYILEARAVPGGHPPPTGRLQQ